MIISSEKAYRIKWETRVGSVYRKMLTWLGVKALQVGRKLLRRSAGRCSWCGADCGFDSTMSNKGLRCYSLTKNCKDMPYV